MNSVTILVALLVIVPITLVYCNDAEQEVYDLNNVLPTFIWDFIVVGAGASGSVVAGRLAQETDQSILLLEGGAKGTGQRDIGGDDYVAADFVPDPITGKQRRGEPFTRYDVPTMADSIRIAKVELENMWDITPIGPFFDQAKVVGGNQATNGLVWFVPTKYDFDAWGLADYTAAKMWPYMKRIENATETGYGNTPDRGNKGRTNIKFATFLQLEQYRFFNACITAGYQAGGDANTGTVEEKIYLCQNNVKEGVRQSTSILYVAPLLKQKKPNLQFRTSAVVTKVLFDIFNRAIGVEYYDEVNKVYKNVYARKEVIIAAGDLQTAKLLYNSGIGPKNVLKAFGKPLRVVNEMIGQKIRNHQRVSIVYSDKTFINANFYNYPAASVLYARTGTGIIESRGLFALNYNSGYGPSPYPDIQAIAGPVSGSTPSNPYTQGFAVTLCLNRNLYANGTVNLTSPDPLAGTVFRANVFQIQEDAERLARGIVELRRIMQFWNGSAVEVAPGPSFNTIPQLVSWIRSTPSTTCHYYGTAPMGNDSSFPTDTQMLVRGVSRLRLVGPAVVPGMIYPSMQGLAVALGEKATDLIKIKYSL